MTTRKWQDGEFASVSWKATMLSSIQTWSVAPPSPCLRAWALPRAKGRSVSAVHHYQVRKRGMSNATLASSALLHTYCTSVLLAVVLFNSVSLYNFPDAGGNILFVSENKADCDAEIGKS